MAERVVVDVTGGEEHREQIPAVELAELQKPSEILSTEADRNRLSELRTKARSGTLTAIERNEVIDLALKTGRL